MSIFAKPLKFIVPRSCDDGQARCDEAVKRMITERPCADFLDAGYGNGELTLEFAKYIHANNIYGIELMEDYRKQAETKKGGALILTENISS